MVGAKNYPSDIIFLVRVLGVPLQFWTAPLFESIGNDLGEVMEVDLDTGRIRVRIDGFQNLCFETTVDLRGGEFYEGEELTVSLRYEKLFGYCRTCFSLCHDIHKCPLGKGSVEEKSENRETHTGRLEERSSSYKGVVIHGSVDTKEKEMERRGYHGKGKEKMYEEPDSKWVKVGDRDNRRSSDGRGKHRGSEGGGQANLQETNSEARSTGSEEGELQMSHHEPINELPLEIGESTEATKEGKEIEKIENDLDLMNEVLGEEDGLLGENDLLDENEMDIDEQEARAFWDDITEDVANAEAENEDVGEDFQELTDEELEKEAEDKEDAGEQVAVDESETQIGRKEEGKNDGKRKKEKKPGAKKQLFKQGIAAGGTKKRLVQSLLSPRKRGVAKTASRQGGEEVKQVEERGPSNPNPSNTKP
ncbi:spliceosome-associated protein CWC27 homolog [Brassica napus]|uniref:spliceosome-associated protein CWC27 homolog n=1 Tax=Brassica napus TaxID=3708 RepID=UPI000BBE15BB|nr:spliceosome-associated protein CWC27 homolog [Brassica napus]